MVLVLLSPEISDGTARADMQIAANFVWAFGDGNSTTNASAGNLIHAYAAPGTFTVGLLAEGPGESSTATLTSYITASPSPAIGSALFSNGSLVIGGTNGPAGAQYRILTSPDPTRPLAQWTPVFTNVFAPDGSYNFTNVSPTNAAGFFILVSP